MSEEEAENAFVALRYEETGGEPVCDRCGCLVVYRLSRNLVRKDGTAYQRRLFKCAECLLQFSATSGTIFASRKMEHRDILLGIALFVNGAKGKAALELSRDLNIQHKSAFVLEHKIRQAISAAADEGLMRGAVEMDASYYGGYVKPANEKKHRRDRRKLEDQSGKKKAVTVVRQRNGRTRAFVKPEREIAAMIEKIVKVEDAVVYVDEYKAWDALDGMVDVKRINHSQRYADGDVSTNWAESWHSRMKRSKYGIHHHLAGPYLGRYADEMAWRENVRRQSNGSQFLGVAVACLQHPKSREWCGYWQKRKAAK